jgi:hypothetical protein
MKLTAYAVLAAAVAAQAPDRIQIRSARYSGSGCKQGTVSTTISPDRTIITFGFDEFQATIGGSSQTDQQKNCQIHLDLSYPSGFQMSVMDATYHGYARLDPGVRANFISSYYFSQDAGAQAMTRSTIQGPEFVNGKTYTKKDSLQTTSMVYSPCGANGILNVNNRIALTSSVRGAKGEVTNDDATFKFTQSLRVSWRRCGNGRVVADESAELAHEISDSSLSTEDGSSNDGGLDPASKFVIN